ncbi:hypothetical protein [Hyperthermus butylicus]|uniref:Uncharacterized protein n=1 Tax=Hyperthermus butylicus (strain DSM 5456 / JCM 9403 / PLM1-5) TaxID=415426 RepID=A2BLQ1_HYPBU|nr:hypothetical protein [Hyperthermus butylicus]ABM80912.1 hypothetical protein Hbut_1069 [Hyperthermus butylicus DSM 5456]
MRMKTIVLALAAAILISFIPLLYSNVLLHQQATEKAYIIVMADTSFARVKSEVPFTLEIYLHVRVEGSGEARICSLYFQDMKLPVKVYISAPAGMEGWLTLTGISETVEPIPITLISRPVLPDMLTIVIQYCDGSTYTVKLPVEK